MCAGVAHLVERHLAKVEVASSSLVTCSKKWPCAVCTRPIGRHSQVVRQSSAKAPPPVRVWVSPPESRNNLDVEGGKPSAPSCFGFFYAQKSHSGAMDVSGVCQATGRIRTPVFRVIHRFSHTAPFFPGEKGHPDSQIFCTKFRRRFYGQCTSPKTGAFFRFYRKGRIKLEQDACFAELSCRLRRQRLEPSLRKVLG